MLDKLLNFISTQKLFQQDEKVLLAISGGIDSMVLAHLFQQTGFNYAIAHCNFQLRENESNEDQSLVDQLATKLQVPFFTTKFDTREYAKKHKISIQMAARDLRRAWFDELLANEGYHVIATGHHLNDSLETTIFNLAKGTGISGLKGITPKNKKYIRPLMFASREMIAEYAKSNQISWSEDRSNISTKYHRNLIRHNVIPELKKINPNLEETFSFSMAKIAASGRIYKNEISKQKTELLEQAGEGFKMDKAKLTSCSEPQIILFELLTDFGFNFQQATDIFLSLDGQAGKCFHSEKFQLVIDRKSLFISPKEDDENPKVFVGKNEEWIEAKGNRLSFEVIIPEEVNFSMDNNTAFLDLKSLEFPLVLRKWEEGDRFQPLGMRHKKKLSDFMIDEKIPLNLKKQVLVLTSAKDIVWVVGHRIDDRYKIDEQTTHVYKICNIIKHD